MVVKSANEFKDRVLKELSFTPLKTDNYIMYSDKNKPENGVLVSYDREGYYNLGIADYTIPKNFSVTFDNPALLIRFGLVYKGVTNFKLADSSPSSFSPSSFFVIEKDLKGKQAWKKGQHFHGTEVTIYERYIREVIEPNFPGILDLYSLFKNYTYLYLPLEIADILRRLESLSRDNALNSIYLEAKILECIAVLINEVKKSPENAFSSQINYGNIRIGNRLLKLTSSDIRAVQKAQEIISLEYSNPPSIRILSKRVFLNEQKLKAGFMKQYHMTIGEYTTHVRMMSAANLLSTTDLSIDSIAKKTGYGYPANFSKAFHKFYGKTPLQFRKTQ